MERALKKAEWVQEEASVKSRVATCVERDEIQKLFQRNLEKVGISEVGLALSPLQLL